MIYDMCVYIYIYKGHLFIVAYIVLIMRILASVWMEQFCSQWMDFHEI